MRELQCRACGLKNSILGKIPRSSKLLKRSDYILIAPQATKGKRSYAATIALSHEIDAQLARKLQTDSPLTQTSAQGNETAPKTESRTTETALTAPAPTSSRALAPHESCPLIWCNAATLEQLSDGNVIQIEPDGKVVVFLESTSKSNYLALTERCNQRCTMCPQPPVTQEQRRLAFNLRLIDLMDRDTEEVGITGGEPTVVEDEPIEVLQTLKNKVPHATVTILTNAVKLADANFTRKIALCALSDLQVDVPLFGATAAKHNHIVGVKTFYRTIKGIYNLAQCGIDVGIRIVVHQLTYQHLSH